MIFTGTDGPGLNPNKPMAIVQIVQVEASIPDGRYIIRNRAAKIYWMAADSPFTMVHFWPTTMARVYVKSNLQVNEHSPKF